MMTSTTSVVGRTVTNQRRAIMLAAVLALGMFWVTAVFGEWQIGVFCAVGVVLGLLNHLGTELTLLRSVEGGELISRKQFAASSLIRLMGISLVAIALAVIFWPNGATVLIGLALFHMIALLATGLPLLKELRKT